MATSTVSSTTPNNNSGGNNQSQQPPQGPSVPPLVTPTHQQTPWQPVIDSSSTQDEQTAAAQYTKVYGGSPATSDSGNNGPGLGSSYSIPNLAMAYTRAPDLVPTKPGGGGSGGPPATDASAVIDTAPVFHIDLSALLNAEQTCLRMTNDAIAAYDALELEVKNAVASDSLFGQIVGSQSMAGSLTKYLVTTYDLLDKEGIAFANSIKPQLEYLMQVAGGLIEMWGSFAALLNNTGQMYAYSDNSAGFNMD